MVKWVNKLSRIGPILSCLSLTAVYLLFLNLSWRRSADPLLDFGREVYTAWRLSEGDLLYRDLASLFGPVASYIDAGIFILLGSSLDSLLAVNAALILFSTVLIYVFVLRLTGHLTAFLSGLFFLTVFGFGHLGGANYNFLTPYSQAAVWGVFFGMGAVVCLERWLVGEHRTAHSAGWLLTAGVLIGLTVLTKPEIAVAIVGASAVAVALGTRSACEATLHQDGMDGTRRARQTALWLSVGATVPLVVTLGAFWAAGSLSHGAEAVFASFAPVLRETPTSMAFYRHWTGLDEPIARIVEILVGAVSVGGLLVTVGVLESLLTSRTTGWLRRTGRIVLLPALLAVIVLSSQVLTLIFGAMGRSAPVLLVCALIWSAMAWSRSAAEDNGGTRIGMGGRGYGAPILMAEPTGRAALTVWLVFSLLLLLKLGFFPRFWHYGFYLAAPGGAALVIVLINLLPRWIDRWVGRAGLARLGGIVLVVVTALAHGLVSGRQFHDKDVQIAGGSDAMWGDGAVAEGVGQTLQRIEKLTPPSATLVVLPEGAFFNYWSRRPNPTPYVSFMPPELAFYGIDTMRRSLHSGRPDFVVLYERPLSDYGGGHFGDRQATGSEIVNYVRKRYRCIERIAVPGWSFDFEIMARWDRPEALLRPFNCYRPTARG